MKRDTNSTSGLMQQLNRGGCIIFALILTAGVARAEIPNFEQPVFLNAKGQSAIEFIHSLFSQIGVPVKIDSEIRGAVNGVFEGTAADVFGKISSTYNVHAYFNRAIVYIYRADDITERMLPMSNSRAKAILNIVKTMNLTDFHNALYPIRGAGLEVVGNKRFVQKVEELALNLTLDVKPSAVKKIIAKAKPKVPQHVVKEFRPKYASVIDKTQTISGHTVTVPGVATMLQQFVDNNVTASTVVAASVGKKPGVQKHMLSGSEPGSQVALRNRKGSQSNSRYSTSPRARIMAHPQTNSVWIEDTAERMAIYQQMISAMDQEPRMVEIEATIIDINNTRQRELGINWRAINGDNDFLLGDGSVQDLSLQPDTQVTPIGEGGILSLVMGDRTKFIARIRALEKLGAAKFVSKPHVITNSNVEAILGATTEFFVRLEGHEAVSLEEKSFGTVLRVTPRVFENGAQHGINLMIAIEDGSASGGQVDNIPEIERSVVGTQAMIQQGQSLLIGGLIRESTQDSTSKVPLLGDIPGIGRLFQSRGQSVAKTERLFLITPRIIGDDRKAALDGPVLLGEIEDIVSTSDQRSDHLRNEIDLKAKRQTSDVNGKPALHSIVEKFTQAELAEDTKAESGVAPNSQLRDLLVIPEIEDNNTVVPGEVAMVNAHSKSGDQEKKIWRVRNASDAEKQWQAVSR